jgi:adenosine deaminase
MTAQKNVELHLHIEGAAPPAFIRALAAEKRQDMNGIFDARGAYDYKGFHVYEAATSVLTSPRDYARLLSEVLAQAAEHGAIYAELFVSPEFCGGGDLSAWRDYLAAMDEAAQAARRDGIDSRAILTAIRHFGPERARKTAICAAETAGGWVTGLGIGGAEDAGNLRDFAWSYDCAREAGLGLTAHAGEWGGPDTIRDALSLGVTRIGHGIRAAEDAGLLRELAARQVTLEVCPGSNIALGLYPGWRQHPIGQLFHRGVKVTVSTDDPPFFATTMTREWDRLADAFDWDAGVFATLNKTALEAAFCDAETRAHIAKQLEKADA